jgi:PAS domain S-box-containing protein
LVLLSILIGIVFWVCESMVHVLVYHNHGFIEEILNLNPYEVVVRIAFLAIIVLFGLFAQTLMSKRKRVEETLQEIEKKYRSIFDTLIDVVFSLDIQGRFTYLSPQFEKLTGYRTDDFIGRPYIDIVSPDFREFTLDMFRRGLSGEDTPLYETIVIAADGRKIHVEVNAKTIWDDAGTPTGRIGVVRDMTQRKEVENALRESEEKFRVLAESTPTGIMLYQHDKWTYANPAAERISGYSGDELRSMNFWDIVHPDYKHLIQQRGQKRQRGESTIQRYEFKIISKEGKELWVDLSGASTMLGGNPAGIISVIDINERKLAEEALKESEHRYRMIAENVHDTIWIIDLNLQFTYVSLSVVRNTGYTPEEIQNLRLEQLLTSSSYSLAAQVLSEELAKENSGETIDPDRPRTMEFELLRKDGNTVWVEFTATFRRNDEGRPMEILGVSRDITERKQTEESLRQSEATYRFLTDKMNDVVWMANLDFKLTYISPSVKKILGFTPEERIRQIPAEMMTPAALSKALNTLNRELGREYEEGVDPERTVKLEMDFCHKNGSIVPMESVMSAIRDHDGTITGIHGVSRDITERKQAEEEKKKLEAQLGQAQKLESIGTLAGGIAHDFNNILAAIIGYTELAMNDISEPIKAGGELKEVLKAGDRAKSLVSQILAFSRQTETKHSPLTLQPIIKESIKMMRSVIPTTIEIRQNLVDSGLVMSDPTQINQIIMNLCTNAVHAMDWTGGVLEVSLKRVSINGDEKTPDLDLPPGHYLKLSVSDTGQGMTPEVMARIFDPYFTTKEVGRGTGLGLSVVHGIVKSHGGVITCRSTYGEGSVFDIYLPEIDTKDESSNPHLERGPLPTGTESILFVDDEPVLIELAKKMIENLGYTVLTRTSSIEALELFRNNPSKFDLVITDMTMPAMTGDKLAQRMMEIRQDIPIILCTGYSEYITEERAKRIGIREFVMKPLVVKELSKTIRKVLDER